MGKKCILKINRNRCKGCGLCLEICPKNNLRISSLFNKLGYHYVEETNENACTGCTRCALICPDAALELYVNDAAEEKE